MIVNSYVYEFFANRASLASPIRDHPLIVHAVILAQASLLALITLDTQLGWIKLV